MEINMRAKLNKLNKIFDEALRAYHRFENLKPYFIKIRELTGLESNHEKTEEIYVFNEFASYYQYAIKNI